MSSQEYITDIPERPANVGYGIPPAQLAGWAPYSGHPEDHVPYPNISSPGYMPCGPPSLCSGPGKAVVPAVQPIIPVPVYQEKIKKDRYIEVPTNVLIDNVIPDIYIQQVIHELPMMNINWHMKEFINEDIEYQEVDVEIPVPIGYNFKVQPKWHDREVPRLIPDYQGVQEILNIDVPQIRIVEKTVDKEVPVYIGEKEVEVEEEVVEEKELVEYQYKEVEEDVYIYKYKPVFDVDVDIPTPLVVPVPIRPEEREALRETVTWEQYIKERKNKAGTQLCCNPDIESEIYDQIRQRH